MAVMILCTRMFAVACMAVQDSSTIETSVISTTAPALFCDLKVSLDTVHSHVIDQFTSSGVGLVVVLSTARGHGQPGDL